jgi:hypothetical protein
MLLSDRSPPEPSPMLTPDELLVLESLLSRARHAAGVDRSAILEPIEVGDLVQLRPGADNHWQTSFLLVCRIRPDGRIAGQILRPHRGGASIAWWDYSVCEVARIGRSPFPEPAPEIKDWSYEPCLRCLREKARKR